MDLDEMSVGERERYYDQLTPYFSPPSHPPSDSTHKVPKSKTAIERLSKRVEVRLHSLDGEEPQHNEGEIPCSSDKVIHDKYISELVKTIRDRFCIRLGLNDDWESPLIHFRREDLPHKEFVRLNRAEKKRLDMLNRFESIIVDAVVKLYRRNMYEGITSESDEGLNASFVEDYLAEYNGDIECFKSHEESIKSMVAALDAPKLHFL